MPSFDTELDLFPSSVSKPPAGAVLNPRHPLADSVYGCWLFNEGGGGKATDLSRFGRHFFSTQVASANVPVSRGLAGLNGWYTTEGATNPSALATVPHISALSASGISVEWHGVAYKNASANRAILALGGDGNTNSGLILWMTTTPALNWSCGTGTRTDISWNTALGYYTGRPVHVVGTWRLNLPGGGSNQMAMYVNGRLLSVATRGLTMGDSNLRFHGRGNMAAAPALTSHLIIYNRALSAEQVMDRYRRPYDIVTLGARRPGTQVTSPPPPPPPPAYSGAVLFPCCM